MGRDRRAWWYVVGLGALGVALSSFPWWAWQLPSSTPLETGIRMLVGVVPALAWMALATAGVLAALLLGVRGGVLRPAAGAAGRWALLGLGCVLGALVGEALLMPLLQAMDRAMFALGAVSGAVRVLGAGLFALWLLSAALEPERPCEVDEEAAPGYAPR